MNELTTTNKMQNNSNSNIHIENTPSLKELYLAQLSPIEQKALAIAMEHLGSSFNILKSNGYVEWMKKKK